MRRSPAAIQPSGRPPRDAADDRQRSAPLAVAPLGLIATPPPALVRNKPRRLSQGCRCLARRPSGAISTPFELRWGLPHWRCAYALPPPSYAPLRVSAPYLILFAA